MADPTPDAELTAIEDPSPEDLAAATALDAQIDALLVGRPAPDTPDEVLLLSAAVRADPPAGLGARIEADRERALDRRWRPFRYVAGVMAYLLISQGIGNITFGEWIADGVGDDFSPHLTREGGFALIAAGIAVLAGVFARRMAPVSAAAGVPLAVVLGIGGIGEIGVFAAGAALHLTQGAVGIALGVTFWRFWRYTSGRDDEDGS